MIWLRAVFEVDDLARRDRRSPPASPGSDAEFLVDLHLGEHGRMRVGDVFLARESVSGPMPVSVGLDLVDARPPPSPRSATTLREGSPATSIRPFGEDDAFEIDVGERRAVQPCAGQRRTSASRGDARQAFITAVPDEAAVHEPPATGASAQRGVAELASSRPPSAGPAHRRRSGSGWCRCRCRCRPVELPTSSRPSAVSVALAPRIFCIRASQTPVAMPQPTSSLPSRIERGSGIALVDQPKRARHPARSRRAGPSSRQGLPSSSGRSSV